MTRPEKLNDPWMVAVWPGMGHVAISGGFYLMAKLSMYEVAEFSSDGLFDIDFVEVHHGMIQPTQQPRNRCFVWRAPEGKRDILVFVGEAQPPLGKYLFCEKLIDFARDLGVQRVFTFAAMATGMRPEDETRVFAAATDDQALKELDRPDLYRLEEGHIGGLNGVLLGAAADKGMQGICLLGEMPHVFAKFPIPKATLAVLRVFAEMAEIELDFTELANQAEMVEARLAQLITNFENRLESHQPEEETEFMAAPSEKSLSDEEQARIELLFEKAKQDRAQAYVLKNELDQLDVFREYEDRFLDLFKKSD